MNDIFPGWLRGEVELPEGRLIEHRLGEDITQAPPRRKDGPGRLVTNIEIVQMKDLEQQGCSHREIAKLMKLNRGTVSRHLKGKAELKRLPDPRWARIVADLVASGLTMYKICQHVGATGGSGRAWAKGSRPTIKFRDKLIAFHRQVMEAK